jgi:hypothetical protein
VGRAYSGRCHRAGRGGCKSATAHPRRRYARRGHWATGKTASWKRAGRDSRTADASHAEGASSQPGAAEPRHAGRARSHMRAAEPCHAERARSHMRAADSRHAEGATATKMHSAAARGKAHSAAASSKAAVSAEATAAPAPAPTAGVGLEREKRNGEEQHCGCAGASSQHRTLGEPRPSAPQDCFRAVTSSARTGSALPRSPERPCARLSLGASPPTQCF